MFTSQQASYTLGTCHTMLKWKPAEENTIDFQINGSADGTFRLGIVNDGNSMKDFGVITLEPEMANL